PARHGAGTERGPARPGGTGQPPSALCTALIAKKPAGEPLRLLFREYDTNSTSNESTKHTCESWQRFKVKIITETPN
ncbi:hypothetical protein Nmel_006400, partial [Mimus melanotis]